MKHTPATPLPWNMQDGGRSNLAHVERDGDGTQVCSIPKARVNDAAYITHAANAYPRLVEALRAIKDDAESLGNPQVIVERVTALLAELGE